MKIPSGGLPGPLLWSAVGLFILGVIGLIANDRLLTGLAFGALLTLIVIRVL